MKKVLKTSGAPKALGAYSQGIETSGLVVTSGQLPIDPQTGSIVEGGICEQTRCSLDNIKAILASAGLDMKDIIKTTVFLKDMNDFSEMNSVYLQYFEEGNYPARSAFAVAQLPNRDAFVEIEAIAAK